MPLDSKPSLHSNEPDRIIELYLKGLTIERLAVHFDRTQYQIKQILTVNGLPIVDNSLPRNYKKPTNPGFWKWANRKRKQR
jgi:hypothetical protein